MLCLALASVVSASSIGAKPLPGHASPPEVCLYCGNSFYYGTHNVGVINRDYAVSNSFSLAFPGTVLDIEIASWAYLGDSMTSIGWGIGTSPGNANKASGFSATTDYFEFTNYIGFDIYVNDFSTGPVDLDAGTYWLTLYDATTSVPGDPALWDMNNGPSAAWSSAIGYVTPDVCPSFFPGGGTCSDAFVVLGNQGATPEPGSLLLLGSGLLGLGGVLYRQAKRDV